MSAAIYYHPEAYTTSGPKLMGRNAAGESFLRGYFAHARTQAHWVQVQNAEHAKHFARSAQEAGRSEPVHMVDRTRLGALSQPGVVYYPGPGIGEHAWHRAAYGHGAWSLCGITHTTSSAGAMDAIAGLLTAPVQPWDAVICTSTAVADNVRRVLQAQADFLQARLGATRLVLPQLPVIPLGVHTEDFAFTQAQREAAREQLGVDTDTLVVLFMGRLSFHAKAHPLAMYQALQRASQATGRRVLLVECGWHANDFIARAYADAAAQAAPGVPVRTLDGRDAAQRQTAWAGADVFCSLSDNIQETFGIVPIEAMAAGLPVVVSDWDGYRDTVRDGVDGFRVPTCMPQAGLGGDLALRHALEIDTYDMYCGHACSLVEVDIDATTRAFAQLFTDAALRARMCEAGRERARSVYDWRVVIAQYESLWAQLAELRAAQGPQLAPLAHPWPARMDPFHGFAAYPTHTLTMQTRVHAAGADAHALRERLSQCQSLAMVNFARAAMPQPAELDALLVALAGSTASTPRSAAELVSSSDPGRQAWLLRSLVWLLKLGLIARI